jgi:6-phosphogluconolactonase
MNKTIVHRFTDLNSVAENTAVNLISELKVILQAKEETHLVLTGGTVGIATLAALAANPNRNQVDFTRVHFWWGDERFVETESADRNALQAKNALLKHLTLDQNKIHEFPATDSGLSLDEAATAFANHVTKISPVFDIVLLGMGPDGHIASLFPGKPQPSPSAWIIAEHDSPKPPAQRLSFTFEALNSSNQVWFIVAGSDKQDAVAVAMGETPDELPVGRVHGKESTQWFIDSAAGSKVFGC